MTAAHVLLGPISPIMAEALLNFIDVADVPLGTDEADAIFARSRELMADLTPDQRIRVAAIVHTLRDVNLRQ